MNSTEHIPIREAAEYESIAEGKRVNPKTLQRRFLRKRIILSNDPEDARRKLVPISALSAAASQARIKSKVHAALQGLAAKPQDASPSEQSTSQAIVPFARAPKGSQPLLAFAVPAERERELREACPPVPEHLEPQIDRWAAIVGNCTNGTWKKENFKNNGDFIRAQAKLYGVGISTIRQKMGIYKEVNRDTAVPREGKMAEFWKRILPKNRPGRSGHSFFADDDNLWMGAKLLEFYRNQAKLSVRRAHELLLSEIEAKQKVWGIGHLYQKPTIHQCRTYLGKLDSPSLTLAREGEEAYRNKCAPYITRTPPERSGQVVGTDQKYLDIICRDAAWNVGRIWMVNFVDVASERWLGGAFGPVLSGDMVMEAAAMMLERCVPESVQFDLGKEFTGKRFAGGHFKLSGERYYAEAIGLWERLGVKQLPAIGENPQTKPIEGWHRNVRPFEQIWPTWTGSNTKDRPKKKLNDLMRQVELFKQGKAPAPAVPSIEQVIRAFLWWAETVWNGRTRGKGRYRRGLTPDEAWNVKAPQGGHRKLTASEIDYYTADHRFLKIARGGQVNLTFHGQTIEYMAPELFLLQDREEKVEVVINRRDLSKVTVVYPVTGGLAQCVAPRKETLEWGEDRKTISLRLRCIATVKRALNRAVVTADAASFFLAEAAGVPTAELVRAAQDAKLVDSRQAFGAPGPHHPEMGSLEYLASHPRRVPTAKLARDVEAIQEGKQ